MSEPCLTRHKPGPVVRWRCVRNDQRTRFGVVEFRDCTRCGVALTGKLAKATIKKDLRAALEAYGCTADEVDAYIRTHYPEEAVREALARPNGVLLPAHAPAPIAARGPAGWPFRESFHDWSEP